MSVENMRVEGVRVEDFMTRRVATVTPDTPILTAARLMLDNHVSGLPVVDGSGRVVGVVTETDLLRVDGKSADGSPWLQMVAGAKGPTSDPAELGARKVEEIMSRQPITVAASAPITDACHLLTQHRIKRLPVIRDDKLVGVVGRADLLRAFAQSAGKSARAPVRDVSVDSRLAELERQIWRNRARVVRPF
jgi:CBS domain-containing protein